MADAPSELDSDTSSPEDLTVRKGRKPLGELNGQSEGGAATKRQSRNSTLAKAPGGSHPQGERRKRAADKENSKAKKGVSSGTFSGGDEHAWAICHSQFCRETTFQAVTRGHSVMYHLQIPYSNAGKTNKMGRPKKQELDAARAKEAAELAAKELEGQAGRALRSRLKNA